MTLEDFQSITAGSLDAMSAYMNGKLKVEGDMVIAMKLQAATQAASAARSGCAPTTRLSSMPEQGKAWPLNNKTPARSSSTVIRCRPAAPFTGCNGRTEFKFVMRYGLNPIQAGPGGRWSSFRAAPNSWKSTLRLSANSNNAASPSLFSTRAAKVYQAAFLIIPEGPHHALSRLHRRSARTYR